MFFALFQLLYSIKLALKYEPEYLTGPSVLAIKLVPSEILLINKNNLAKNVSFNKYKPNLLNDRIPFVGPSLEVLVTLAVH
jgi:hypothetical protein